MRWGDPLSCAMRGLGQIVGGGVVLVHHATEIIRRAAGALGQCAQAGRDQLVAHVVLQPSET